MDINEIMKLAGKNKQKALNSKPYNYSTNVPPPKKLQKNVNPNAIKALLEKKSKEKTKKEILDMKKKEALIQLRQKSKKTMAKANAMAKRTKDNFHGLTKTGEEDTVVLSPEQEKRHKRFMKSVEREAYMPAHKEKYTKPLVKEDNEKNRKMKKVKKKARAASNLNFNDLLQIAQNNKDQESNSESDETDSDSLSIEEKYKREKRKRRELEEKLKISAGESSSKKRKTAMGGDKTLSQKEKMEKIKAIAKNLNKSKEKRDMNNGFPVSNKPNSSINTKHKTNGMKVSKVTPFNSSQSLNPKTFPSKCTLKVTNESVRTNYPGVAQRDPYSQKFGRLGGQSFKGRPVTAEQIAMYRQRKMELARRRQQHLFEDDDSEDDSDMEGFIEDEEEEAVDVSQHIKSIFGYDKTKYKRESEWELSRMDAGYKDIEKEERISLRVAKEEDAREARLEEERMKKKLMKKKK